jgi:ABC-type nitrate/sulfonate/bicarbonate transport system substrate-binding protein
MMIHSAMKRISKVLCFFVVECGFFYSVFGAAAPVGVRMGYPQPSGAMLPIWVMTEARLDHKYGFELQNIYISGDARLTQTLVSGDIDMASSGGAVVNAILSGAEIVGIAASVPTYGFSLYARPDLKDVPSLKGKVIGVMTKGASSDHAAVALLRRHNLQPGQDVKFLYLGGVREASAALERGIVSASVLSAPTTLLARRLGFKEVVNIADLKLPYVHSGLVTSKVLMRQQPDRVRAFLKAYVASIKITNENPEISKRALARYLATNDGSVIDEAYQSFRGVFPKIPYFTEAHIKSVLAVTDHPKAASADPKDFFDNRFLKELEDTGFIGELYGQH